MVAATDQNAVGGEAVPDILSQGGGRERGPWPRRAAVAALLVLAAVVIVHHLPDSRHATARPARAAATATAPAAASGAAEPATGLAAVPASYPPDADPGTAAGTAQEVSIAGRPLGPQLRLPPGYRIEQGTDRGLLLAPVAPRPGRTADQLWDPAAPQASRTFDAVIAASTTQIAWAPPCATRCRVLVLNLATGRQVTAELPEGRSAASATFSPDGSFLAVEVSFSSEEPRLPGHRAVRPLMKFCTSRFRGSGLLRLAGGRTRPLY